MSRKAIPTFETEKKVFPQKLKGLFSEKFDKNGNPISQKALADYLGVSRQSVGYYMQGQSEPSFDILVKIAQFFDVTTDYLLTETPLKSPNPSLSAAASYTGLSEEACFTLHSLTDEGIQKVDKIIRGGKEMVKAIMDYSYRPRSLKAIVISGGEDIALVEGEKLQSHVESFLDRLRANPRYGEYVSIKPADELIDNVLMESIQERVKAFRLSIVGDGPEIYTEKGYIEYSSTKEATNGDNEKE